MIFLRKKLRTISVLLIGVLAFSVIVLSSCTPSIEKMKSKEDVEGLIKAATYKSNTYGPEINASRSSAREALLEIGTPAIEPLIEALQSDDQNVVKFAIELLGEMQDARAAEGLIYYRYYDSVDRQPARDTEAEAALYMLGPAANDAMIDALDGDNADAVQFAFNFLEIFETENGSNYLQALIGFIQDDEYGEEALYRLSRSAHPSIMEVMLENINQKVVADGYFTEINVWYIQPVLEGQAIAATPYSADSPSPHPVVVADESPFEGFRTDSYSTDPLNWNAYLPFSWRALGQPESIQLVLSWDNYNYEVIETANYSDGTTGTRQVVYCTVTLREAATGEVVATTILRSKEPQALPWEKNYRGFITYTGEFTPDILIDWLRPYVED